MQLVSIVAYFGLAGFPAGFANLTGTRTLDRTRSDFGGDEPPSHYGLQIAKAGPDLAVTVVSGDVDGQRVTYRQCRNDGQITGLLLCLTPDGVDETWRIAGDSLTITRLVTGKSSRLRQRLVLVRCTELE